MARIRQVKPELFDDADLGALPAATRWVFAGLLTQADKEGRLVDNPPRLKTRLCAYDDTDVNAALDELARHRFIYRYQAPVDGAVRFFIQIRTFTQHQHVHKMEADSKIPAFPGEPGNAGSSTPSSWVQGYRGTGVQGAGPAFPAPSVPAARVPRQGGGAGQGTYPRDHLNCTQPCGRICLPRVLFAEFEKAHGGPQATAEAAVRAFHEHVNEAWGEGGPHFSTPIGEDRFTFWRARWREHFASTQAPVLSPVDALYHDARSPEEAAAAVRAVLATKGQS